MKKTLIALAVLATAGVASAQSSVTLFGIVDAGLSHYSVSGGTSQTALSSSGNATSRLGFRGTEDLGGGMSASFWLEGQLFNDTGNPGGLNFTRRSTLSLAGSNWGEVRLGRDYTPTFWNDTVFDPFGTTGVGANIISQARGSSTFPGSAGSAATATPLAGGGVNNPAYVRASNSIGYFLPGNLGGFYGQAMYALHEQTAAGSSQGKYVGLRVGYANGPVNVALATGKTTGANPSTAPIPDVTSTNLGGMYDFGVAKLTGEYARDKISAAGATTTGTGYLIGGIMPVGAGEFKLAYSRVKIDDAAASRASKLALGYVHNLSKRTALYASYARISNTGAATLTVSQPGNPTMVGIAGASASGYDFGIRHSF